MQARKRLLARAEALIERIGQVLPAGNEPPDWACHAFRWRRYGERGQLQAFRAPHRPAPPPPASVESTQLIWVIARSEAGASGPA
jgi:predicted AAA+ superfamily ATPase